jgi:peroxiredoxin
MRPQNHSAVWSFACGVALVCLAIGCQKSSSNDQGSAGPSAQDKSSAGNSNKSAKASGQPKPDAIAMSGAPKKKRWIKDENVKQATNVAPVIDAPTVWHDDTPAAMPRVLMSEGHAATCLVKVGQTLPDVTLADLNGHEQQLSKLMGDRLTVVVLWSSANVHAQSELSDLAVEVASPMAARGVRVVGISERDTASRAKESAEKAGVSFPILIDAEGKYFGQLATEWLPRTYLLDGAGKILWLDIEYSRITHHDLMQAIRFALSGP